EARKQYGWLPAASVALGASSVVRSAQEELHRGIKGMLGRTMREGSDLPDEAAIVLGTLDVMTNAIPGLGRVPELKTDGYWLKTFQAGGRRCVLITAANDRGVLYGTFALLRRVSLRRSLSPLDVSENPHAPIRFLNHWDNLNGTIERGYAGQSIFWQS